MFVIAISHPQPPCSLVVAAVSDKELTESPPYNNTVNVRINVTLRCVRVTVVVVDKQYVLNILSACL